MPCTIEELKEELGIECLDNLTDFQFKQFINLALCVIIQNTSSTTTPDPAYIYAGERCYLDGTEEKIVNVFHQATDLSVREFRDVDTNAVVDEATVLGSPCESCCNSETTQMFTLFSKYSDPHPDAASYPGIVYIGSVQAGSTHPAGSEQGSSITNWNVFAVCASTLPADDSNTHYWLAGSPDSFGSVTFSRVNPDPVC